MRSCLLKYPFILRFYCKQLPPILQNSAPFPVQNPAPACHCQPLIAAILERFVQSLPGCCDAKYSDSRSPIKCIRMLLDGFCWSSNHSDEEIPSANIWKSVYVKYDNLDFFHNRKATEPNRRCYASKHWNCIRRSLKQVIKLLNLHTVNLLVDVAVMDAWQR